MQNPDRTSDEEIQEYLNGYLDAMMQIYGEIRQDWEQYKIVNPKPGATTEFKCNNCGKCCSFEEHWVWVYPSDMIKWIRESVNNEWALLYLCILFPVEDADGYIGYGLPSQKVIVEKFNKFIKQPKQSKIIKETFKKILKLLRSFNPGFDNNSNYCIFYNPNIEQHCLIHKVRPIQCKSYPYDYPQFTDIKIPDELSETYGKIDDDLIPVPLCPREAFIPHKDIKDITSIMTNEQEREWVLEEKTNYLASTVTQEWQESDISDMFLELYHKDLLLLDRTRVQVSKPKKYNQSKSESKSAENDSKKGAGKNHNYKKYNKSTKKNQNNNLTNKNNKKNYLGNDKSKKKMVAGKRSKKRKK